MFIKQILIWVIVQSCLELHQARTWHYIYKGDNVVDLGGGYVMAYIKLGACHAPHLLTLLYWEVGRNRIIFF